MAPLPKQAAKAAHPGLSDLLRVELGQRVGPVDLDPTEQAPSAPKRSIAIVGSRGIPARYGGFETAADVLARRLVAAGHRVIVTCEASKEQGPAPTPGQSYATTPLPH